MAVNTVLETRNFRTVRRYIAIARPDHWIKNIFMIPGIAIALVIVRAPPATALIVPFIVGTVSLCLAASANYTINEYLDSSFDRHHPIKGNRPGAQGLLSPSIVAAQYLVLALCSVSLGFFVNLPFSAAIAVLLTMGLLYNVAPIRTKDRVYLDTLSESINNPIRLLLGWFIIAPTYLPPASALLAYWMAGAFLMGVKRYSEFSSIKDPEQAALYRRSFRHYTENSLLLSCFFYAICSAFFIGIFLIKYRIEFLITAPMFSALFTLYLAIGLKKDSAAQAPEKLYREKSLMALTMATFIIGLVLFFVDIPFLHGLMEPHIIHLGIYAR